MKFFETPVVEVKKFDIQDVLTASGTAATTAPTETEFTTFCGELTTTYCGEWD